MTIGALPTPRVTFHNRGFRRGAGDTLQPEDSMSDERTAMTWKDGKWIPVPVNELKECRPGKPEDCPRCNALSYLDLSKRFGTQNKEVRR